MLQPVLGQPNPITQTVPRGKSSTMIVLFLGFGCLVLAIFSQWHGNNYDMPEFDDYDGDNDGYLTESEGDLFAEETIDATEWRDNWQSLYSLLYPIGTLTFGMGLLLVVLGPQGENLDKWVRAVFMAGVMWFFIRLLTVDVGVEEILAIMSLI